MKKFNPLKNRGTARVFYAIVNGKYTASQIAEYAKTERTTVYDQINRLKKINFVKIKPPRKGFDVDWDNFYSLFIDEWILNAYEELFIELEAFFPRRFRKDFYHHKVPKKNWTLNLSIRTKYIQYYKACLDDIYELYGIFYQLKKKAILKCLVKGYVKFLATEYSNGGVNWTIKDSIDDFEEAIPSLLSYSWNLMNINKKQRLIINYLRRLYRIFIRLKALAPTAIKRSFQKIK